MCEIDYLGTRSSSFVVFRRALCETLVTRVTVMLVAYEPFGLSINVSCFHLEVSFYSYVLMLQCLEMTTLGNVLSLS